MMDLAGIVTPLLKWYRTNARPLPWRESRDPYAIWVSEIMLQQTRVEAVKPYYRRFLERLPDIQSLAEAEEELILKLWEGLGYYSRVRNMQKAARIICSCHGGRFPQDYEEILALPGIGPYTAGAVGSIAFDLPEPAVDGNVLRVLSRVAEDFRDIADTKVREDYAKALRAVYPAGRCGEFTQSLMELGAVVCAPGGPPLCGECPLAEGCLARSRGTWDRLPVKAAKRPRRREEKTVLLLCRQGQIALQKRPEKGLLAGLWELPTLEGHFSEAEIEEWLWERGLAGGRPAPLGAKKHIFTHVEWHMEGWRVDCEVAGVVACAPCRVGEGPLTSAEYPLQAEAPPSGTEDAPGGMDETLRWASQEELEHSYSLPSAFRQFL